LGLLATLLLQGSLVLVVLDDVGQADLDAVSAADFSQNIDYLKSCGIEYRNAHANPSCSPSRRSLLFGEYYTEQADIGCNPPTGLEPPLSLVSLPESIPTVGSYFVGKWHLGSSPTYPPWELAPQVQGFDTWRAGTPVNLGGFCGSTNYTAWLRVDDGASALVTSYNPRNQRDQVIADIKAAKTYGEPFFFLVSLNLAHGPFHRPPANMLLPAYPATFTNRDEYEAMIAAADLIIGAIVAELDLAVDAIIVTADNGTPEPLAPNPAKAKFTTFERGTRVPLIASTELLGSLRGTTSTRLVHLADLYSTVSDWFGEPAQSTDGISLFVPVLHENIICGNLRTTGEYDRCARGPRFKFRRFTNAGGTSEELYDLLLNPQETVNLQGDPLYATQEAFLRIALDDYEAR
jgi:arylsulfatase A-like enzyme